MIYLFILNEDINDTIKIIKSLEDSVLLIDVVTKKLKTFDKKTRRLVFWCCISIFGCFIGTLYDFFSYEKYFWKSS